MPGWDGTGPMGLGPGTGRGLGPCGAGMAWRLGGRFAFWRRWFPWWRQGVSREELLAQKKMLEQQLEAIKEELAKMEKEE